MPPLRRCGAFSKSFARLTRGLPNGLFDNNAVASYLARLFSKPGRTDDFRKLAHKLFIVAADLDTGKATPFGAPGFDHVPISEAVKASAALPGLYPPARIDGRDYVDGALKKTLHASVALKEGAKLLICINPLVPYDAELAVRSGRKPMPLAERGLLTVLSQTFRALIHSRMRVGMDRYATEFPDADVVLFEPARDDEVIFFANIFSYADRRRLAEHAYRHTLRELERRDERARADPRPSRRRNRPGALKGRLPRQRALARSGGCGIAWGRSNWRWEPRESASGGANPNVPRGGNAMPPKPPRRTRERILETALEMFNELGEPTVATTSIAFEMGISPGNLYYHYHSKEAIVADLFAEFRREIEKTLAAPEQRLPNAEDCWLFLHLVFEAIWKYRFIYRDINDLVDPLSCDRGAVPPHPGAQDPGRGADPRRPRQGRTDARRARRDHDAGAEHRAGGELLDVVRVRPRSARRRRRQMLARGAFHVIALAAPYLEPRERELFDQLAKRYIA